VSGNVLLDSNIVVALFDEEPAAERGLQSARRVYVPSIVLGELYYGAEKSGRRAENLARVDRFGATGIVLAPDIASARRYGAIRDVLRRRGRPIPDHDIWVAAIALQHDLTLISRDGHFREIEGLDIESWQ
jgi:tRNA(fMet)-specific endonuclease VapC